jgi:hypothetical protein
MRACACRYVRLLSHPLMRQGEPLGARLRLRASTCGVTRSSIVLLSPRSAARHAASKSTSVMRRAASARSAVERVPASAFLISHAPRLRHARASKSSALRLGSCVLTRAYISSIRAVGRVFKPHLHLLFSIHCGNSETTACALSSADTHCASKSTSRVRCAAAPIMKLITDTITSRVHSKRFEW